MTVWGLADRERKLQKNEVGAGGWLQYWEIPGKGVTAAAQLHVDTGLGIRSSIGTAGGTAAAAVVAEKVGYRVSPIYILCR